MKVSLLMIPLTTVLISAAYLVFAGSWKPLAGWLGLAGGALLVLVILISNFFTPVFRLPYVK
jgi:hypothetical protein